MPDAPVVPPASPAPPAAPNITFGTTSTPASPAPPTPVTDTGATEGAAPAIPETPEKYEFKFEGDDEAYAFEEKTDDAQVAETYDATKPFDPAAEAALKDHPEILKALKDGHYELRQLKSELQKAGFKTTKDLKAYKSRIDALGGPDKIEQETSEWATTMTAFQSGDPAVIEKWGKENPDGMVKLFPSMLTWLNTHNPSAYAGSMAKVMKSTLIHQNDQGMSALKAFNALYGNADIQKIPGAKDLLDAISGTFNDIWEAAKFGGETARGKGAPDERQTELDRRERSLQLRDLNAKASPIINTAIDQAMKIAFKGLTLSPDVSKELRSRIAKEFNALQLKDETFQKNARATLNDPERFLKLLKSAVARNLPIAARREARLYKGIGGGNAQRKAEGQTRTETGAGTQPPGDRVKFGGPWKQGGPDPQVIDYEAMRVKWGRKNSMDHMLEHLEFIKKGSNKIYYW